MHRDTTANEARLAALRRHGQPPLVAVGEDCGHLFRRRRLRDDSRLAFPFVHPITIIRLRVGALDNFRAARSEICDVGVFERRQPVVALGHRHGWGAEAAYGIGAPSNVSCQPHGQCLDGCFERGHAVKSLQNSSGCIQ